MTGWQSNKKKKKKKSWFKLTPRCVPSAVLRHPHEHRNGHEVLTRLRVKCKVLECCTVETTPLLEAF
jgi:hypothetical protein